jgi:Protein of unknown function, DUF488
MEVYSIGFTKKKAEQFFELLKSAKIARLIDVRLNNMSQLAAFAKRDDLQYFLREICGAEYVHEPRLAPTQDILDSYKKREWFMGRVREKVSGPDGAAKESPLHCHRRLMFEYRHNEWGNAEIRHL